MANVVIIVGDTGTGKSTSVETLDPEITAVIKVVDKPLPFRGSNRKYSVRRGNAKIQNKSADIVNSLEKLATVPQFENVFVDDIGFSMLDEFFEKANVTGYDKFAKMGVNMQKIIVAAKKMPERFNVFLVFHNDIREDNTQYKIKLIGKMLDDKYNPLAVVSVCLFSEVVFDKDRNPIYSFITNRTLDDHGIIIPAKSPRGMFESLRIPNDLSIVVQAMRDYYNDEQETEVEPTQENYNDRREEEQSSSDVPA